MIVGGPVTLTTGHGQWEDGMNEGVYDPAVEDIDETEPGSDTRGLDGVA
jgi:hypothetical protein